MPLARSQPRSVSSMAMGVSTQRFRWRGVWHSNSRPQPWAKQRTPVRRLWNQQ